MSLDDFPPRVEAMLTSIDTLKTDKSKQTVEEARRIATEMIILIDKDHNNTIEFDEYVEFRRRVGKISLKKKGVNLVDDTVTHHFTEKVIDEAISFFWTVDSNGDGKLSHEEIVTAICKQYSIEVAK